MEVQFNDVSMTYDGSSRTVLNDMSFTIEDHSLVSILGPSGCGKSTTLMLISGLLFPSGGKITFNNRDVTRLDAVSRKVGMVFQNYALYPHLSVIDNIAFPLKMAKVSKKERMETAREFADLVQISDHLNKKPNQLSGGQQQRVAIARALAKKPSILLMDEPLSNLDAKLRTVMREEIRRIQQQTGVTTVFVTHDQAEALSISDKVMVLDQGVIQQSSTPMDLYENPQNLFVAKFLGSPSINTFSLDQIADALPERLVAQLKKKDVETIGIRPESLTQTEPGAGLFTGEVTHIEIVGKERTVKVKTADGTEVIIADIPVVFDVGDQVSFGSKPASLFYFDSEGIRMVISDAE